MFSVIRKVPFSRGEQRRGSVVKPRWSDRNTRRFLLKKHRERLPDGAPVLPAEACTDVT